MIMIVSRSKFTIIITVIVIIIIILRYYTKSNSISSPSTTTSTKRLHLSHFSSIEKEINDANQRYKNQLLITQPTTTDNDIGYGVYTTKQYNQNDIILQMKAVGIPMSKRISHSVQIDLNKHVIIDLPGRFLNHSCDANCGILQQQYDSTSSSNDCDDDYNVVYNVIALRDIHQDEELFVDYETFEYEISAFEECMCGVPSCRKVLGGFKKHGKVIREKYGDFVADYLKDMPAH